MILSFFKQKGFNIFIYLTIAWLVYYLSKNDILLIPKVYSYSFLFVSILFLALGFAADMYAWSSMLKIHNIKAAFKIIIISSGIGILGKYLPGKVWTVMGRAKVISDDSPVSVKEVMYISFESQILMLWTGLMISLLGAVISGLNLKYSLLIFVTLLIFSVIIFSNKYKVLVEKILLKLINYSVVIPKRNLINKKIIIANFLPWICWLVGFYFLASSITASMPSLAISFAVVISSTFGVIALFAPGGLGVREGILTGYLVLCGIDISLAVTISVFSRLWFLAGELTVFIAALILRISGTSSVSEKSTQ